MINIADGMGGPRLARERIGVGQRYAASGGGKASGVRSLLTRVRSMRRIAALIHEESLWMSPARNPRGWFTIPTV